MPVMEPNLDAARLKAWARVIDGGPFSSLCWGERIVFENPDRLTLLGALAAWTDRVRLMTTVVVPELHDPVMLPKGLATGDMLSGGRLTVGIGVGGRHEDYHAVGADPTTQTMRGMADRVAVMKRVWSGEKVTDSVVPVGPSPVQSGGPPLLIGSIGPKTVRSAAAWADGVAGMTLGQPTASQRSLTLRVWRRSSSNPRHQRKVNVRSNVANCNYDSIAAHRVTRRMGAGARGIACPR